VDSNNGRPGQVAAAVDECTFIVAPQPPSVRRRELNRALPGTMIDLIHNGVSTQELRYGGDRAVYNAAFKTAASATQRGWECW